MLPRIILDNHGFRGFPLTWLARLATLSPKARQGGEGIVKNYGGKTIAGHADVNCALLDHGQNGAAHSAHGADFPPVHILCRRDRKEAGNNSYVPSIRCTSIGL